MKTTVEIRDRHHERCSGSIGDALAGMSVTQALNEAHDHCGILLDRLEAAEATIARQSKIIDEVYRVLHEESLLDICDGRRIVYTDDIHAVLDVAEDVG